MTERQRFRGFAEGTRVPVMQTRNEIEALLKKYGASAFAYMGNEKRASILFEAHERRLRFDMSVEVKSDGELRRRWRSLLLVIKAKLDGVVSGIETFEEAFMAHVVMPDGKTAAEHALPLIASAYKGEPMQPLLPAPRGA